VLVVVLVATVVVVDVAVVGVVVVDVAVAVVLGVVGTVVVVVGVVVVGMLLVALETVAVVGDELPLSEAITARAAPTPITTATRSAIVAFIAVLIPPPRGGCSSGSRMMRFGSSCIAGRV
jgi:hypothetical protein